MARFSFPLDEILTPESFQAEPSSPVRQISSASPRSLFGLRPASGDAPEPAKDDQFCILQLNPSADDDAPSLLDSSEVTPGIEGSSDEPDVKVGLEMLSFHVGSSEEIDPDTRATIRVTMGKDPSSSDRLFDTVFWSIAAGLRLYNGATNEKTKPGDAKADFRGALANRPIEIPGGLGVLQFEVIKHKEPDWWQKVFRFLRSDNAESLISVLGFPAITQQAITVIDELLNRFTDNSEKPLFESKPLRLALSKRAADDLTGGNPRVKVGVLRPGICILARGRDLDTLLEENLWYYPTHDRLVPADVSPRNIAAGDDPLNELTYAVLRVRMKSANLDPSFGFPS